MIGAYIAYVLQIAYGFHFAVTIIISMIIVGIIGIIIERVAFRPLQDAPHLTMFISAFAVAIFLEEFAAKIWGTLPKSIPSYTGRKILTTSLVSISYDRLIILVAGLFLIFMCYLVIQYTKIGRSMRALAQNRYAAQLMGLNIPRISSITFAIGSALGAAAGALLGVVFPIYPTMGMLPILKGFVIIILGGIGSIGGAVLAGLFLGIIESLGAGYISSDLKDAIAFIILVVFLIVKPTGIFGAQEEQ
jgi:branched-chain amino acid transport system permease protein